MRVCFREEFPENILTPEKKNAATRYWYSVRGKIINEQKFPRNMLVPSLIITVPTDNKKRHYDQIRAARTGNNKTSHAIIAPVNETAQRRVPQNPPNRPSRHTLKRYMP